MIDLLSDIRVLDFGIVTAGGGTSQFLADYGADVIKVESHDHPDLFRHWQGVTGEVGGQGDLGSPPFRTINRNKRGIAIDLKHPRGRELALQLAAHCDVVVENFRKGTLDRLGLSFRDLATVNKTIVLASLSSQGQTGPESSYGSFGSSLEALGGIMSMTGYDADSPLWSGNKVNYPDQVVSILAPALIMAGIISARRKHTAMWLDLSQREVVTSLIGEWVLQVSLGNSDPIPRANAGIDSLEWCSPCTGDDNWIAISLHDIADVQACCSAIKQDAEGICKGTISFSEPTENLLRLQKLVATWSKAMEKTEAMRILQSAGVSATAVMKGHELLHDPYLVSRGFFQEFEIDGGTELQRGRPFSVDKNAIPFVRRRAPHVGEHTSRVLKGVLGLSDANIEDLVAQKVVHDSSV